MILAQYSNGGTRVALHEDGTKIRDIVDEEVGPVFPEQMDLKITDWCDAGCAWCHEKSTLRGKHGDVESMIRLLRGLPAGVEIAIGGGDPLSHPEFPRLVRSLSLGGLIPNVTVNGRHLERWRGMLSQLASERAIFGIGVSFHGAFPEWHYPHLVDHMIAGVDDPRPLLEMSQRRKILVLGYKSWGRGAGYERKRSVRVQEGIDLWGRLLPLLGVRHHLSFDNLAIKQLEPSRLFRSDGGYAQRYMGKEGEYSLYVDGVKEEYSTSSYAPDRKPWTDIISMFQDVRGRDSLGF